ncbi:unnamed protein product (macronuclear) [Paramecium tetraurelia]|uniref:EGF-like domain-containing protein n=1 Tax=Paramecium tetraurelia TaxID=5888 RepID=A0CHR2_PARTE|nr:uncharacterized protein GSPATT00038431001 [Paramecium tetraurelia]CAK70329.1 unnamed protein product [Paramecium tetraurelia]|eukprot:XP_001437726.1 hypothetical protein (macronuclear) [Paramecium tetraurelia strain d4-2]
MYSCEKVISINQIQCVDANPEQLGYSKMACDLKSSDCTFSNGCYQKKATENIKYCSEFPVNECNKPLREGCKIEQNKCVAINPSEYSQLECNQVSNKIGCINIITKKQFCQFNEQNNICELINLEIRSGICKSISQINSQVFCEQIFAVPCKHNSLEHKCENAQGDIEFQCIRGLNQIACLTHTQQSLQCKFYNYCYGPNYNILNCDPIKIKDCCFQANTIESCLFQDKFLCQWQNEECKQYSESNQECLTLNNVSRKVCYNIKDVICIFNLDKLGCVEIQPNHCEQVQTKEQCIQFNNLPCYWDFIKAQCLTKVKNPNDGCQDIQDQWGSERTCLDVVKQGQMCIFQNQCTDYTQQQVVGCSQKVNKLSCLQQVLYECIWDQNQKQLCLDFNQQSSHQCDSNLSYLACLNINTPVTFCQWKDNQCKNVETNQILSFSSLSQCNCNTCGLINDGSSVICDTKYFKCLNASNLKNLTCDFKGMNKQACLNIKDQQCKWDDTKKKCLKFNIQSSSCSLKNINPASCSSIQVSLPCGSKENDCDQVDVTKISCDYPGLNEHACLQITNYPCGWVQDDYLLQYQCKLIQDFDACLGYNHQVNAFVCTQILDAPCFYNSIIRNCILFKAQQEINCNLPGINGIGCSKIENCVYLQGRCMKYEKTMNLNCEDALFSNHKVCTQIQRNRCKYNNLGYGCISSELQDICSTKGINQVGCDDLLDCQWNQSQCLCKAILTQYPDCSFITNSRKCQNLNYCYVAPSNPQYNVDISQEIIDQNLVKCLRRTCDYYSIDQCDGQKLDTDICYLTQDNKCNLAKTCDDIVNPQNNCLIYTLKNKQCFRDSNNKNCITSPDCESLDAYTCQQFPQDCIFEEICKTLECYRFTIKQKCIDKKCEWLEQNKSCMNSQFCASQNKENCMLVQQNGKQCALIEEEGEDYFCSVIGCRYLLIKYSLCNGAQIGDDVCVPLSDSTCVSCQEIMDPCICLQYENYCEYDKFDNLCKSKQCGSFNHETCPADRCQFNEKGQICIPLCENNYNRQQCNHFESYCTWDKNSKLCIQLEKKFYKYTEPSSIIVVSDIHSIIFRIIILIQILQY